MRTTAVIVAVLALLVIAGCAKTPSAPTTTDKSVSDVGNDVTGLGDIESDLDTSELNSLDQELADIETLELQ